MANKSNANLGKSQEAFEDEQHKGLDGLFNPAAPESVDLAAAERVGVLASGMADKIEKTLLPNHAQLFAEAYNPNGVEYINDDAKKAAFKRAFEVVYGRFLYEQHEFDQANMDPSLKASLDGALKFSIEEKGLKGRPELLAAMRHLKMAKARGVNTDTVVKTAFTSVDPLEMIELEREHTVAVGDKDTLAEHYKYFSGKGPGDVHEKYLDISKSVVTAKELRELGAKVKKAEEDRDKLTGLMDLFSEAKTGSLNDTLQEFEALGTTYDSNKT